MFRPTVALIASRHLRSRRETRFASFVSMVSVFGIALGVAVLIIVLSVMNGFENEVSRHILGMTSHATILRPGKQLHDWQSAKQKLDARPEVIASAPFIRGGAMLNHRGQVHGAIVQAVDFIAETQVSDIAKYLEPETIRVLNGAPDAVVLGRHLMRKLNVSPGQKISLIAPRFSADTGVQSPGYFTFTVAGEISVGMHEFDSSLALLSIANAQRVFNLGDAVSGLRVRLVDRDTAPVAAPRLAAYVDPSAAAINWTQYHRNFFRALKSQKRIMFVILSIIVAVAAFNIVAAMVMLVREKRRDIAILRTLGISRSSVMLIFIAQGSIVGIIGVLLGVTLGLVGAEYAGAAVAVLEQWLDIKFIKPDVYYIDYLPATVRSADVLRVALVAGAITIAATVYPAWRAALTNPAEALRYE